MHEKINIPVNEEHIRMAMDHKAIRQRLAAVLIHGDEERLHLSLKRAFPWSLSGRGVIEYEISMRDQNGRTDGNNIFYAHFSHDSKRGLKRVLKPGSFSMTSEERGFFLKGKQALALTDPPMILSTFPLDIHMSWLPKLMKIKPLGQLLDNNLSQYLMDRRISQVSRPKVLGYRFSKRCTLMYDLKIIESGGEEPSEIQIIGKTYQDSRGRRTFSNLQQLWNWSLSASGTRPPVIPRPLCYVPDYRICFREAKKGFNLSELKVREVRQELLSNAGELLSSFHASNVIVEGHFTPEDEINLLNGLSPYLPVVQPEFEVLEQETLRLIRTMARQPRIRKYTPRITHRDFYDKQVIVGIDGITLTDFDTITMSDQAIDVGNFLAHIFLRSLQLGESREEMIRDSFIFLSAYILHNPSIDVEKIAFYRTTSLFRLACVYAYRPSWEGLSGKLLEECWNQTENTDTNIFDLRTKRGHE